jgi:hypothetical protein
MHNIIDYLKSSSPETWAIYVVGVIGFWVTTRQIKQNFRLKKKADTFEDLSKKIRDASESSRQISNSTNSIIGELGSAADSMTFDATDKSERDIKTEIDRRVEILNNLQEKYSSQSSSINSNTVNILNIIKDIEKSTVAKEKTRVAARYLFYEANEQYQLMNATNSILVTIQVVPLIGEKPNVPPETFRAIRDLVVLISEKNNTISGYLDDLEIILHNDLVKGVYGKAKNETIPARHLGYKGLRDNRTKSPLL